MLAPTDPVRESRRLVAQPLVFSVPETAHLLGISRAFAYELIATGKLPHVRLGRRIVVPRRVVEAIVAVDADASRPRSDVAGSWSGAGRDGRDVDHDVSQTSLWLRAARRGDPSRRDSTAELQPSQCRCGLGEVHGPPSEDAQRSRRRQDLEPASRT